MWNIFKKNKNALVSCADGEVLDLTEVNDEAFSSLAMGNGYAIKLEGNKIVAPVSGTIEACFPTGHAIGIHSDLSDIIVHIGIDTVELNGEGFHVLVKIGDKVKASDLLVEIDREFIESKGYDTTTMVVLTTGEDIEIEKLHSKVKAGEVVANVK